MPLFMSRVKFRSFGGMVSFTLVKTFASELGWSFLNPRMGTTGISDMSLTREARNSAKQSVPSSSTHTLGSALRMLTSSYVRMNEIVVLWSLVST